jgi:MFS family permease
MRHYDSSLLILYVASGALQATLNMVFLAVPIYALAISASPFEIGLMGAVGGLTYSLMARFLGGLSDRFSKRSFIILGAVVQAVVPVAYPFCSSTSQLIPLRVVQSLGLALFWPAIEAMVAANTQNNTMERALVGYNISWSVASTVGAPIAGFLITAFSVTLPFYVSSALALSVSIMLLVLRNRTEDDPPMMEVKHPLITAKGNPSHQLLLPMLTAFAYSLNAGLVGTLFPVSATRLGISAYQIGLLFLLSNLVQTLVFVFSEKLLHRFGKTSFLIGAATSTVSLALIALIENVVAFMPSFIGLGLAQGILYSSSLYYLMRESGSNRGHVTGSFESTLGLASFLGPFLGGVVAQFGSGYPYAAGAVLSFLILVVQLLLQFRPLEEYMTKRKI